MGEAADRATSYRQRAAELRAVAEWMNGREALAQILATALEYERMADTIEKLGTARRDDETGRVVPALSDLARGAQEQ